MKIIDVHNHLGTSADGGVGNKDELIKIMNKFNILHSIIFATDEKDKGETFQMPNERIFASARSSSDRLIPFVRLQAGAGQLALDEFEKWCQHGARGLKLKASDGYDANDSRVILDLIKGKKYFPVLIHTAHDEHSQPLRWLNVIKDYPDINFIMAHGGKDNHKDVANIIQDYPHIYTETSTLSYNRTKRMYDLAGPDKILFGSDYPYSRPEIEILKYRIVIKNEKDLKKIFYDNSAELLGLGKE